MCFTGKSSGAYSGLARLARTAVRRPRVPQHLRRRYLPLNSDSKATVENSLRRNFFSDRETTLCNQAPDAYLGTPEGKADLENHVLGRLQAFRQWTLPWLDSLFKLDGAYILEIGCGTGASTIALAEQGAHVTGVDVSAPALQSARDRCAVYGLTAEFVQTNATEIASVSPGRKFDAILFFAVLEHLTWGERIDSLRAAWDLLPPNGVLAVIEAPNRLWYVDIHTTQEPFYHWLPDETAIAYTRHIGQYPSRLFEEPEPEALLHLARLGRGVSYHDFVIAWNIAPEKLPVAGHMAKFHERALDVAMTRFSPGGRFRRFLARVAPGLHPAFLQPSLDLAFRR
jgi:2-polyprenyl-3-methyl-5-hydroxy-6-metoxy-1,4-benzoquinol methylase